MKKILTILCVGIFLLACEHVSCGCVNPESSMIDGKWKLAKITYGFPAPNMPTFTTEVENEIYEFNTNTSNYSITKNGKEVEKGSFSLESNNLNNVITRKIIFKEVKLQSDYSFANSSQELILYQRSYLGANLADGSNYHYQKVN